MNPTQARFVTIFDIKKYSYLKITWTLIFPLLQSSICIFLTPVISHHRHLQTSFRKNRSSVTFDPADINLYSIDSLIGIILEACEFPRPSPKFWCKQIFIGYSPLSSHLDPFTIHAMVVMPVAKVATSYQLDLIRSVGLSTQAKHGRIAIRFSLHLGYVS